MSNKANELFSTWYEAANPNPDASILPLRVTAINKLVKEPKTDFWLDLVRIYLDLQPKDSNTLVELNKKFVASDKNFPTENNENLIRCLASALLCFKLEEANNRHSNLTCLAILNANFLGQYQTYDKIPTVSFAWSFYKNHAISAREAGNDNSEERLDSALKKFKAASAADASAVPVNAAMLSVIEELKKLNQANKALAEESNVLWWLFSGYSSTSSDFFKNLDRSHLALVAAKELSELTTFDNGFESAEQVLSKALNIDQKTENISLFDVINSVPEQLKINIINEIDSELNEMTPCLLAIKTSLEGGDWSNAYKNYCNNGNVKNSFTILEISMQLYREFLFLSLT